MAGFFQRHFGKEVYIALIDSFHSARIDYTHNVVEMLVLVLKSYAFHCFYLLLVRSLIISLIPLLLVQVLEIQNLFR